MKFPILASVIIFVLVINHAVRKNMRKAQADEDAFWEREARANSTRKKSLDGLRYITIPLDALPTDLLAEDLTVQEYIRTLQELSKAPIVNLTGYTNTDLKLEYGTANITALSQYDQSYTLLASTLQLWADALLKADLKKAAVTVMEFAIDTETDVSRTYYRLAEYYLAQGTPEKISHLIETAQKLRSSNRDTILKRLKEMDLSDVIS